MGLVESLVLLSCIWCLTMGAGGKATEECSRQFVVNSKLKIEKEYNMMLSSIHQKSKA